MARYATLGEPLMNVLVTGGADLLAHI